MTDAGAHDRIGGGITEWLTAAEAAKRYQVETCTIVKAARQRLTH